MRKDLSIQDTFGELRGLSAEVMPPFFAAIRTKDYHTAGSLHRRVIICNINLLTRTRGSDEEIMTVLLPYQLAFLKSMSDPFQAEFSGYTKVKYPNSYCVKDRLKSLHELRIHHFSCSRGMLLVQQASAGPFVFPPVQDLYRVPYFSALKSVMFRAIPESTLFAFLCNPSLRGLKALELEEGYVGESFIKAFTDPLSAPALESLEYLSLLDVVMTRQHLLELLEHIKMLPHLKILKLRGSEVAPQEVSATLPNLTVFDVRGDYLDRDDIRARFNLSPDCEILL